MAMMADSESPRWKEDQSSPSSPESNKRQRERHREAGRENQVGDIVRNVRVL